MSALMTRRLVAIGVVLAIGVAVLALSLIGRGRLERPGLFVVLNQSRAAVVVQMLGPLRSGHAYVLEPGAYGPHQDRVPYRSEVSIFTTDCKLLGTSHVEGDRFTVVRSNGSIEIVDMGDMAQAEFIKVDRCPPAQE